MYSADTLQMEITTNNNELLNIRIQRELFDGVETGTPCNRNNLNTFNTVIRNYETTCVEQFISGLVDLRGCSNLYLTIGNLSNFTVMGPRGQANVSKTDTMKR